MNFTRFNSFIGNYLISHFTFRFLHRRILQLATPTNTIPHQNPAFTSLEVLLDFNLQPLELELQLLRLHNGKHLMIFMPKDFPGHQITTIAISIPQTNKISRGT